MNLLHLQHFYSVAQAGSFSRASRLVHVSQPALSLMVRALEETLGKPLLERSRNGVRLTSAGEVVYASASRIFAEAEAIPQKVGTAHRELRGSWTVAISDNLAIHVAPVALGRMRTQNPNLRISLFAGTSSQIKTEILEDRAQLGIFFTPVGRGEALESETCFETEFWIVLSPKALAKRTKGTLRLSDLARLGIPRIESRHRDYSGGFPAHFHSHRLGLSSTPFLEVNQHEVKKNLVLEGFGYALLTKPTVEAEVRSGKLLRVQTPERLAAPVFAAWKRGRARGPASDAFLAEFLKEARRRC